MIFPEKNTIELEDFQLPCLIAIGYLATNRTPMRYRYRRLLTSHQPSRFHQGVSIPFRRLCSKGPLQKSSPCHVIIELIFFFVPFGNQRWQFKTLVTLFGLSYSENHPTKLM
jgi:hypothetical protein